MATKEWSTKKAKQSLFLIAVTALLWFFILIAATILLTGEAQGGSKCDSYAQGYKDGYCSEQEGYGGCYYTPMVPMCFDSQYTSDRQAYHKGYSDGKAAN